MTQIIILDSMKAAEMHGNLYHNRPNQIRRQIGQFTTVYTGDQCGTVRDRAGKCWDWWYADDGKTVRLVEAV